MDWKRQETRKIKKELCEDFCAYSIFIMFLFSRRLKASRNSFLFSPAKFKLHIMSLTEISALPKFSCRLWRCFTMDRSSLPQRQVVFRIKTTIVLTSACSLVCLLDKSPIAPNVGKGFIVLKGLCLERVRCFQS